MKLVHDLSSKITFQMYSLCQVRIILIFIEKKKWKTELISSNCDNVPRYLITIVSYIILRHEIVLVPTVAVDREGHVGHPRPRLLQGQGRLSHNPR